MNAPGVPPIISRPAPLTRERVKLCVIINVLGGPGVGTYMSGQRKLGAMQFSIALSGVLLVLLAVLQLLIALYRLIDGPAEVTPFPKTGWVGLGCFLVAWVWALFTSISLWRATREPPRFY